MQKTETTLRISYDDSIVIGTGLDTLDSPDINRVEKLFLGLRDTYDNLHSTLLEYVLGRHHTEDELAKFITALGEDFLSIERDSRIDEAVLAALKKVAEDESGEVFLHPDAIEEERLRAIAREALQVMSE